VIAEIDFNLERRIERELERRGAAAMRHGRGSRLQHLQNTHDILETWGARPHVRLAGLVHSAYLRGSAESALFDLENRRELEAIIGANTEALVHLYATTDRDQVFAAIDADAGDARDIVPARDDLDNLLAIHLANAAEQTCAPDGSPAAWLARAAHIAQRLDSIRVPALVDGAPAASDEDDAALIACYMETWRRPLGLGQSSRLAAAAAALPLAAEPFVLLALGALARGERGEVERLTARARALLVGWNAAWDKRLSPTAWLAVVTAVAQMATAGEREFAFMQEFLGTMFADGNVTPEILYARLMALDVLPNLVAERSSDGAGHSFDASDDGVFCDDDFNAVPARFVDFLDGLRVPDPRHALAFYPDLTSKPWWDARDFPIARALEASAAEIIAEFERLDLSEFHAESEKIKREGSWDVFLLHERGKKREERCALVPVTTRIIERHGSLLTQAGLTYFSRLAPNTIVAPHRGPTNIRLRCHLGIKIPSGCGLSVDNVTRSWEVGRCIVFDDSYTHAVWNSSDEDRIVLIVDLWHPELSEEEISLLSGLHRYGFSVAESLNKYWERNEEAIER
jgi:aspartate beta-hydroxylase